MSQRIVIIGQTPDLHIERVSEHLRGMGAEPILFERFHPAHHLSLALRGTGPAGHFSIEGRRLPFESVDAVWYRWKPAYPAEWTGAYEKVTEEFTSREWRNALRSLPSYIPHARWVNPLCRHFEIQFKPVQMALAQAVGLRVPETRSTNDPDAVAELFAQHQRIVYKTLSSFIVPPDEAIYTNEIHLTDVSSSADSIRQAPGIFQELIEKRYELRVTIVRERIFSARIDSQDREATRIDWRHSQMEDMYQTVEIDEDLTARLLDFHRQAGLLFGAYDLIVPHEGPPVFLECNPGGQWLWLEIKLGLPIARAVAELLLGK